ncbi:MAG: hypothetical protein R3C58_03820 [Parvularculaceae bacterium]
MDERNLREELAIMEAAIARVERHGLKTGDSPAWPTGVAGYRDGRPIMNASAPSLSSGRLRFFAKPAEPVARALTPSKTDGLSLAGEEQADIGVIGAGYTGLHAALRLAKDLAPALRCSTREPWGGAPPRAQWRLLLDGRAFHDLATVRGKNSEKKRRNGRARRPMQSTSFVSF